MISIDRSLRPWSNVPPRSAIYRPEVSSGGDERVVEGGNRRKRVSRGDRWTRLTTSRRRIRVIDSPLAREGTVWLPTLGFAALLCKSNRKFFLDSSSCRDPTITLFRSRNRRGDRPPEFYSCIDCIMRTNAIQSGSILSRATNRVI